MILSYKFLILPTQEVTHKLLEAMDGRKLSTYETQKIQMETLLRIRGMQRNLPGSLLIARCKKGSNNQRDDFLHKLSKIYANDYNNICIEDLDVRGLKEKCHNTGMHRSIHDAAWAKFRSCFRTRLGVQVGS